MTETAQTDSGVFTIDLAGEEITLTASLSAALSVNKYFNGFASIIARLEAGDLEAMIFIIQAGAGLTNNKAKGELSEKVWRNGIADLAGKVTPFVISLANGGKNPEAEKSAKGNAGSRKRPAKN